MAKSSSFRLQEIEHLPVINPENFFKQDQARIAERAEIDTYFSKKDYYVAGRFQFRTGKWNIVCFENMEDCEKGSMTLIGLSLINHYSALEKLAEDKS